MQVSTKYIHLSISQKGKKIYLVHTFGPMGIPFRSAAQQKGMV
jgi:hypothetical protein